MLLKPIKTDCQYNDSDEDCNKCVKHGFIFSCMGCKNYKPLYGEVKDKKEEE